MIRLPCSGEHLPSRYGPVKAQHQHQTHSVARIEARPNELVIRPVVQQNSLLTGNGIIHGIRALEEEDLKVLLMILSHAQIHYCLIFPFTLQLNLE